jgi:sigma-B regulation protein RsbU (phosphoserine phosphatase)
MGAARWLEPRVRNRLLLAYGLYGALVGFVAGLLDVFADPFTLAGYAAIAILIPSFFYDLMISYLLLERRDREGELAVAQRIQAGLFPSTIPVARRWSCAGHHRSARTVGGDYWDVIPVAAGRQVLVVADVSGKGVPAAILMSALRSHVHLLAEQYDDPVELVTHLNRIVCGETEPSDFATVFLAVLDEQEKRIHFVNAGHPPALLVRTDGAVRELGSGGLPVGIEEDASYRSGTIAWEPGDRLVLYSDGVLDAEIDDQGPLDPPELVPVIAGAAADPEAVVAAVVAFVSARADGDPEDDVTILACTFW